MQSRRHFAPRISLRAFLLLVALIGLVLAPVSAELYEARKITRQKVALEAAGILLQCSPREPERTSTWLIRRLSPWEVPGLGEKIDQGLVVGREWDLQAALLGQATPDLAALSAVPELRTLTLVRDFECSASQWQHGGMRRLELMAFARPELEKALVQSDLLPRFPRLQSLNIQFESPRSAWAEAVTQAESLEELEVDFAFASMSGPDVSEEARDLHPLAKLKKLRVLRLHNAPRDLEWSFLEQLGSLEEFSFSWWQSSCYPILNAPLAKEAYAADNQAVFAHLSHCRNLTTLKMPSWTFDSDLAEIAGFSHLESLEAGDIGDGYDSLCRLSRCSRLRSVSVSLPFGVEDDEGLLKQMESLRQVTQWKVSFGELDDRKAERLSRLGHLERLEIWAASLRMSSLDSLERLPIAGFGLREDAEVVLPESDLPRLKAMLKGESKH